MRVSFSQKCWQWDIGEEQVHSSTSICAELNISSVKTPKLMRIKVLKEIQ